MNNSAMDLAWIMTREYSFLRSEELCVNGLILLIKQITGGTEYKVPIGITDMNLLINNIDENPIEIKDILLNRVKYRQETLILMPDKIRNLLILT